MKYENFLDENSSNFQRRFISLLNDTITQAEIADKLGTSRQNVGNWLKGKTTPDISMLSVIADKFNVSTDFLLGRTDIKTSDTTVQDICDYTGLNDISISSIKSITSNNVREGRAINAFFAEPNFELFYALDEYSYHCLKKDIFFQIVLEKFIKNNYPNIPEQEVIQRGKHLFNIAENGKLYGYDVFKMQFEFDEYYADYLKRFSSLDRSLSIDIGYEKYKLNNIIIKSFLDVSVFYYGYEAEINEIEKYFSTAVNSNMSKEEYREHLINHLGKIAPKISELM